VSEQGISVTGYPDHKPCQVCGEQCGDGWGERGYASVTISQRRLDGTEELAYLCIRCFAAGILHAARLARESERSEA
jgi:hypothetical protein